MTKTIEVNLGDPRQLAELLLAAAQQTKEMVGRLVDDDQDPDTASILRTILQGQEAMLLSFAGWMMNQAARRQVQPVPAGVLRGIKGARN